MHKVSFGVRIPHPVESPTGKPSKKKAAVKAAEQGDFKGGERPKPKKKKKAKKKSGVSMSHPKNGFTPGTIPKVEKGLRDAGA